MDMNIDEKQAQLIKSSLSAAVSSLNLALDLLGGSRGNNTQRRDRFEERSELKPLITGTYDGDVATCTDGKTYTVAPSYSSKVALVFGDTLKVDRIDKSGRAYFMQYKRVKRKKDEGVLAKKDGKWVAVTSLGSYKVLPEAVERWQAVEGDEVSVLIPEENINAPFAAIEEVKGKEIKEVKEVVKEKEGAPKPREEEKSEEKPKEKKVPVKKEEEKKESLTTKTETKTTRVLEEDDLR
jgi:hypothetical protein